MKGKYVVKRKGKVQKFNKNKIVRGCVKAGAKRTVASKIASEVARKTVAGMSTRRIGEMTITRLKRRDKKAALNFNRRFKRRWP